MTRQILLSISFDGTKYHGFQAQINAVALTQVIMQALEKVFGEPLEIKGCSRTDSGVHAIDYSASIMIDFPITCEKIPLALNAYLPMDVRVNSAKEVALDFHPRYSAKSKTYIYRINNSAIDSPFENNYIHRVTGQLDLESMQKAAQLFCGTHDFKAFMSAGSSIEKNGSSTVRNIIFCEITKEDNVIKLKVTADGFLYHMVRIMIGTIIEIGQGRRKAEDITAIIESKNRNNAGTTASAKGLFLYSVEY